jgi:hypothetical protein
MDFAEVPTRFSQEIIEEASAAFFFAGFQFDVQHPFRQALMEAYCWALNDALKDELEGRERTPADAFKAVVDHLPPDTPQEIVEGLKAVSPDKFNESYKILRVHAGDKGLDIAELADGLEHAMKIAGYVARLRAAQMPAASEPKKRPWWKFWG